MIKFLDSSGYYKLKNDKQKTLSKAAKKLESQIYGLGTSNFCNFITNNPVIHDSYGNFYVYKFRGKGCSVRLLYKYSNNVLEIHMFHFKKGDKDNSKYIETFESYAKYKENCNG